MRTYKQQRREFVLLAMKLIEKENKYGPRRIEICSDFVLFYDGLIRYTISSNWPTGKIDIQISALKDLLKEQK